MDVLITKGFHCIQFKTTHKSLEDSQPVCSFRHYTTFTLYHPFIHLSGERHFGRKVSCPGAWKKHLAKALTQDLSINAKSALGIRPPRPPTAETRHWCRTLISVMAKDIHIKLKNNGWIWRSLLDINIDS